MTTDDAEARTQPGSAEAGDPSDTPSARAKALPRRLPQVPPPTTLEPAPPALTPARMINEVLYCERLTYLEYVQGEWADNAYTADGQAVHRKVNEEAKPLRPAPDQESEGEDERPYVARSVWLPPRPQILRQSRNGACDAARQRPPLTRVSDMRDVIPTMVVFGGTSHTTFA